MYREDKWRWTELGLAWPGEFTVPGTDGVLWNCASETYVMLLTSVNLISSIKRKNVCISYNILSIIDSTRISMCVFVCICSASIQV